MNLGIIKKRLRILRASTTATRWNDQWLADLANQAQVQISLDVDYPEATQIIQTIVAPPIPVLTLVTGPTPSPVPVTVAGNVAMVPVDGSATVEVSVQTPYVSSVQSLNASVSLASESSPYSSLSVKTLDPVLSSTGLLTFNIVVTGGLPGNFCTVFWEAQGT